VESLGKHKLNTQIVEEASAWFIECRAGDLQDAGRREFDRWLRKSPEHLAAYLEMAGIWNEGPQLDPTRKWDADTLIAQAAKDHSDKVVALPGTSPVPGLEESVPPPQPVANVPARGPLHRRKLFALAASLAALTVLALGGAWIWLALFSSFYSTGVGEQRSLELADGSTVSMNSKSRIHVRYSKAERAVDLIAGQALFHVAKDHSRPFVVSADGTRVRAVGTQFDVYERRAGTVVTVLEGEVAVLTPSPLVPLPKAGEGAGVSIPVAANHAPAAAISLLAGEQLTVTPRQAKKAEHPNTAAATAWTERRIVFESATLSEVAEEFNRYNERQLVIEDPGLYDFHISGVFSSTDPESLIRFLRERPGVKVTETDSQVRVARSS
jgi:transmembrane sensor